MKIITFDKKKCIRAEKCVTILNVSFIFLSPFGKKSLIDTIIQPFNMLGISKINFHLCNSG